MGNGHPRSRPARRVAQAWRYLVAAALLGAAASICAGEAFPVRPLRLVVPFPAGGTPDANARALGRQLQAGLKQTMVIDNRSGADGIIGADHVAKAQPDGYTYLYTGQAFLTNVALHRHLPYDVRRDFAPVTQVAVSDGYVLAAHPALRANTVSELIAQSKNAARPLRYGSPGIGSSQQLAAELFNASTGARLVHVPYRGLAPAIAALLAGDEVQIGFAPLTVVAPQLAAGRLRAIATTAGARWKQLPDTPTVAETIPGFKFVGGWHGLFAPAKTPAAILDRMHREVRTALAVPELRDYLQNGGYEPVGNAPAEFAAFVAGDVKRWIELARIAGLETK
jgi:tripartite-type tricarboxylate transporter receptor subunit TctC